MTKQKAIEVICKLYVSAATHEEIMQIKQALQIAVEALKEKIEIEERQSNW